MKRYIFNPFTYSWSRKKSKVQIWFDKIKPYWWDEFWYNYHWNGMLGPGGYHTKSFKSGNLALILSVVSLIIALIILIYVMT